MKKKKLMIFKEITTKKSVIKLDWTIKNSIKKKSYNKNLKVRWKQSVWKQIVYNEIYPPTIEKQMFVDPCERSVYQLLEKYSATEKGNPKTYKTTKKDHATLF